MSDLKRFDINGTEHVNGHYCNAQEAADLIEQLRAKIGELAATVERLREASCHVEAAQTQSDFNEAAEAMQSIIEQAPHQNLNAIKREVYVAGYMDGYNRSLQPTSTMFSQNDHKERATQYANTKYPSDKDGE